MHKYYHPPEKDLWKGREDGERFHQVIQCLDLSKEKLEFQDKPCYGFLGFVSDEGVRRNEGRMGASEGPFAIRKSLANLALHQLVEAKFFDVGNIVCEDQNLEEAQKQLGEAVASLLNQNVFPIVLGGGHESAWGIHQGVMELHSECAIVNFDAHLDLRPLLEDQWGTSGTSFSQIAEGYKNRGKSFHYTCLGVQKAGNTSQLFETAEKHQVKIVYAENFCLGALGRIQEVISYHKPIHLTICLDVFAAAFAPGVSAPQAFGILPKDILTSLSLLAHSKKVVVLDIAELSPQHDRDGITAKLASNLIAHFLYEHIHIVK
ncbi:MULTISPECIES: formimidoylglutamase [Parachlamydia]|uniref:formimidoylglutamase n=1 Tax=Parachlamydia TaxID=83551 RepID=UPI0001C17B2E|nr:formimidoylglutamase [Parachlamydia acanthamoebae]EFB42744.1 hypothetical protein pah_c003o025 [Parachlamydia acanthamoebae str. Hall's coccus]